MSIFCSSARRPDTKGARSYAAAANECAQLAAKLEKDAAFDKIADLERVVAEAKRGRRELSRHKPVKGAIE